MAFGTGIKKVQQGSGTATAGFTVGLETVDVTITAVVQAKATVEAWLVSEATEAVTTMYIAPVLTSPTNLRLYISVFVGADKNFKYTWQVVEHY